MKIISKVLKALNAPYPIITHPAVVMKLLTLFFRGRSSADIST
jgi:hypothetical protein